MKILFIAPNNDAEGIAIQEMLKRNNQEYVVTNQQWGASWEQLEEEIKKKIPGYERIYGIELKGNLPSDNCVNIDHHVYYEEGDEAKNKELKFRSSLRQVADILGTELTEEELFYEANDVGYIPEMRKLGEELKMSETEISAMIRKINEDEAKAQGVTDEIRMIAREAIDNGYIYDERLIWIDLSDFRAMREATNILYRMGKHKDMLYETTVIDTHDGGNRIIVFGNREKIIRMLTELYPESSWSGGKEEHGYFGIQLKDQKKKGALAKEIRYLLEEKILGYHRLVEKSDIVHSENYGPNLNIHQIGNPTVFHRAIGQAKSGNEYGSLVHTYGPEEYGKMKLFVVNAGAAGIAIKKDGDIVSVFKNPDMANKDLIEKISNVLLIESIKNGGRKLDCFDGFLPELYSKFGFTPIARLKFNDEFAPEKWDYERDGRPNIIFMAHNGESLEEVLRKQESGGYIKYREIKEGVPFVADYEQASEMVGGFLSRQDEKRKEIIRKRDVLQGGEIKMK
jgi:hypothetical protein